MSIKRAILQANSTSAAQYYIRMPTRQKPEVQYGKIAERLQGAELPTAILNERKICCANCPLNTVCLIPINGTVDQSEMVCPTYLWPRYSPQYQIELPEQTTNHLIYHIYPRVYGENSVSVWKPNFDILFSHWKRFNGLKRIAIVHDKHTEDTDAVKLHILDLTGDATIQFVVQRNNPALREVGTFINCLKPIAEKYRGVSDLTFSAHAKGIKYSADIAGDDAIAGGRWQQSAVWKWVEWMYKACLNDWPSVRRHLSAFPFAGAFKRYGQFTLPKNFRWHYSGTFYWMRNQSLFSKPDWARIAQQWMGTEAYPAGHYDIHETSCLFNDNAQDLYLDKTWEALQPEIATYNAARA